MTSIKICKCLTQGPLDIQVEKAFRVGTARQNAHCMFVCLALKLLEERVHVAFKEISTLQKQVSIQQFTIPQTWREADKTILIMRFCRVLENPHKSKNLLQKSPVNTIIRLI